MTGPSSEPLPSVTAGELRLAPIGGWTRPMRWMIALMTAVAMLAAALALWAGPAAAAMRGEIGGRLSIQLVEADPAARRQAVERLQQAFVAAPFVRSVTIVPDSELLGMARDWLGSGVDRAELPLPAIVDVDLVAAVDADSLASARALASQTAPRARVIVHRDWLGPLVGILASLGWMALLLALSLLLAAAGIAAMSARAALAAQRSTIELFHLIGATDAQIARLFQRVIVRQALIGAAIGSAIALLLGAWFGWLGATLVAGMAGRPPLLLAASLLVPCLVVLVAIAAARMALARELRDAP